MARRAEELLAEAQDLVESSSRFGPRQENWELQKRHEADWALPVIRLGMETERTRVLDIGCGYGTIAVAMALLGHEVTGVDIFVPPPAVNFVDWRRADAQAPDGLPEGSFGVVVMTEVIEHLSFHPSGLLADVASLLTDAGAFVGATPVPEKWSEDALIGTLEQMEAWSADLPPVDAHVHLYTEHELLHLFRDAGLRVDSMRLISEGYRRLWIARAA